jgi:ACS family glucarate transporter-like MFS transporter
LKRRHQVLFLLSLLSAITYLDRVCISVAGPRIQHALGLAPAQWGWVGGVFAFSYGLFEIPSGYLGDRIGARAVLSRIVLWWSCFTALTGVAWNYLSLLVTRFLFGVGEAGALPNACVSLSRWFPPVERARAMGIVLMAAEVGTALTPLLVVPIQKYFGWRSSFFALGLIGAVWVIAWRRWYQDHPKNSPRISPTELAEIGPAPGNTEHTLPWRHALRSRNLWTIALAGLSYRYGIYFFQFWLHTYLVNARGYSETALLLTAWLYAAGAGANVIGGVASDALVKRLGMRAARRAVPFAGLVISAVCLSLTIFVAGKYATLALLALSYCGITFAQASCWAVCMDVGAHFAGAVSAVRNTAAQLGATISSVVFGYMAKSAGSYDTALIPVACMIAVSAVLCLRIDATEQLFPEPIPRVQIEHSTPTP